MKRVLLRAAVVAFLLGTSSNPANAASPAEVLIQDDQACIYQWHDRAPMLGGFKAMGGTHVRINVIHFNGDSDGLAPNATLAQYDSCVTAIIAAGLVPQITLLWDDQQDPAKIAGWAREMAAHFAALGVHRFSILNEPDLTLSANDACGAEQVEEYASTATLITTSTGTLKRVRYRGRVRRVATRVASRGRKATRSRIRFVGMVKGHRVKLTRRGRRFYRLQDTRRARTTPGLTSSARYRLTARGGCLFAARGDIYRRILDATAPAIRAADPDAEVWAGETSPHPGSVVFAEHATRGIPRVDVWAHHCYRWDVNFARTADVARAAGLPGACTEFGILTNVEGATGAQAKLAAAWADEAAQGSVQMSQYQVFTPHTNGWPWDSSLETQGGLGILAPAIAAWKAAA